MAGQAVGSRCKQTARLWTVGLRVAGEGLSKQVWLDVRAVWKPQNERGVVPVHAATVHRTTIESSLLVMTLDSVWLKEETGWQGNCADELALADER